MTCAVGCNHGDLHLQDHLQEGGQQRQGGCPVEFLPPPLPSLSILSPPDLGRLLHTPHLRGAAVMLLPSDPLLLAIAAAQAADPDMSATIATLRGGSDEESNLVLP